MVDSSTLESQIELLGRLKEEGRKTRPKSLQWYSSLVGKLGFLAIVAPYVTDFIPSLTNYSRVIRVAMGVLALAAVCVERLINRKSQTLVGKNRFAMMAASAALVVLLISSLWNEHGIPVYVVINCAWTLTVAMGSITIRQWVGMILASIQTMIVLSSATIFLGYRGTMVSRYFDGTGYPLPLNAFLNLRGRQSGIFSHPNTLGEASALVFVGLVSFRPRHWRVSLLAPLFSLCVAGGKTSDLAAVFGTAAAAVFAFEFGKTLWKSIRWCFPVAGVVYTLFLVFGMVQNPIDRQTATGRGDIWLRLLSFVRDHLVVGLGPNFASRLVNSGNLPIWATSAHNSLVEGLIAGGIPVLLCIGVLLGVLARVIWRGESMLLPVCLTYLILSLTESIAILTHVTFGSMLLLAPVLIKRGAVNDH